ncbi:MAG TPA: gamma-glutamylcyclotransferase family protein [bacterium]|nr:gamma-glutamylcyclotransferase family protein [bacterium]
MPRGNIKMTYYLCYGSPLMDRSLDRKVDTLRLEGQGRLDGFKLAFSRQGGQPNLEAAPGAKTWGCLFLIEERMLPELDKIEAGGARHQGQAYFEGKQTDCVYYTYPSQPGQPNAEFLAAFRSAYDQASLPQGPIDQALGLVAK